MAKKISYTANEWIERLKTDLTEDYQIGLHQVGVFGTKETIRQVRKNDISTYFRKIKPEDFCKSIVKTGLKNRWDDITHTLSTYGSVEEISNNKDFRQENFLNYDYNDYTLEQALEDKDLYDVVVAVPLKVNVGEKEYSLGYLEYPSDEKYKQDNKCKLFDGKDIPKEFIYGYIHKHKGRFDFTPNALHFAKLSRDEQSKYIENLVEEQGIDVNLLQLEPKAQEDKVSKIPNLNDLVKEEPTPDELEISKTNKEQGLKEIE